MKSNALIELGHGSSKNLPVTVRLQVWHYNERGRCPEFNHGFARLFSSEDIGDWNHWTVHPVQVVEPVGIAIRDDYVPVEVDFVHDLATYNNDQGNPESGVRDIFKKFAPAIVYRYFLSEIESPPHAMNIYAVADGEEIMDKRIKTKLLLGADVLPLLPSLILACMDFQGAKISEGTDLVATAKETLAPYTAKLRWLKNWLEAGSTPNNNTLMTTATSSVVPVPVPLEEATKSFEELRKLASELQPRLEKLSSGKDLTNQGIIRTINDLHKATIHLSKYERTMRSFDDKEIDKLGNIASSSERQFYHLCIPAVFATFAIALGFWSPDLAKLLLAIPELSAFGGVAITGGAGNIIVNKYLEKNKAQVMLGDTKKTASDGRIALKEVQKALCEAQAAMAWVYIVEVMRQPIECMGQEEMEKAVKILGGDPQYLNNKSYNKALIKDRLDKLIKVSIKLDTVYNSTLESMKFHIVEELDESG
ncbi:hypothetical protein V500_11056 [Pseudogymnoascus sp. VKM F-4518 (FW-2643)]|nr:hypothetical protein V500_11056 [Pseudogymnoascus sp. VKM F-4518 (FW-2643)]